MPDEATEAVVEAQRICWRLDERAELAFVEGSHRLEVDRCWS